MGGLATPYAATGAIATLAAVAAYGALHSLLASHAAKRRAQHALGPGAARLYRLGYNTLAIVTLLPVLAVPALIPGPTLYTIQPPWLFVTSLGQLAALGVLALGLLQTDVWHFLGLRQLTEPEPMGPPRLVVSGLYRWVRHPLYTAGLAFIWLSPVMTTSLFALDLSLTGYILIGSRLEERRLRAELGPAYAGYQRSVPWLLPLPWRKGQPPSSQHVSQKGG